MKIQLRRNESFYLRDGWIQKSIIPLKNSINVFYKNDGIEILGIGANMVKSLKYWLSATNIISGQSNQLTSFGLLISQYDGYLESSFTWFFVHFFLVSNFNFSPVAYSLFNDVVVSKFSKKELLNYISEKWDENKHEYKKDLLDDDISIILKSYTKNKLIGNPEENFTCPLSDLGLLSEWKGEYSKEKPTFNSLNYLIIFYCIETLYLFNDNSVDTLPSFDLSLSLQDSCSPTKIFNLDKNVYFQYLNQMENLGLIKLDKTAGLNIVHFQKRLSLDEIFEMYFKGSAK